MLVMNVGLMSLALIGVLLLRGESPWSLIPAILLIFVELAVITAFALLFSSLVNPILAAVATGAIYFLGHLSWGLELLKAKVSSGFVRVLCDVAYWALPDFERLNIKIEAVHGLPLASGFLVTALLYGLGYTAVVLVLAMLAFERKEFL